ncbi:transporter substrate-binding domain-containing protein [Gallaecimonas kandeliae]|uniref:transporter substrate-binding domain-containing protein n=1 Tax=Gallaecimonas kandeliae TaxID=3029055 RepID=UPI0026497FD2|nr:transporter substrate-binding domain-containing protein [Gallaecimonas kandeliae]WKE66126.1 transporter substrate-binding domain-containing protein [Gallaecimonas kandeliae]
MFGTEATYPPFEYRDDAGQLVGVDVDIAHAICEELQRPCIIIEHPFDSLLDELEGGDLDAVIAALDISSHYDNDIRFSDPYYRNAAVYVTLKSSTDRVAHSGYIGVQNGSSHQQYLIDQRQWQLTSYDELNGALNELRQGRISAIFVDSAVANAWLSDPNNSDLRLMGSPVRDLRYFGRGMGIALAKGRSQDALLESINKALEGLRQRNQLDHILAHYLKVH